MTLGELLSKRSAQNSSIDNSNIHVIEQKQPEDTPQIVARRTENGN